MYLKIGTRKIPLSFFSSVLDPLLGTVVILQKFMKIAISCFFLSMLNIKINDSFKSSPITSSLNISLRYPSKSL